MCAATRWLLIFVTMGWSVCPAAAQEFLTLSVAPGIVEWTVPRGNSLIPGRASNPGSNPVTITTSWNLSPGRTWVDIYVYFDSASAALRHQDPMNTTDIPSSAVQLSINGAGPVAVTGTVPFGAPGAGVRLLRVHIVGNNRKSSRSDAVAFNIDLSSLPQLPPDDYSGVITIQAQATP